MQIIKLFITALLLLTTTLSWTQTYEQDTKLADCLTQVRLDVRMKTK